MTLRPNYLAMTEIVVIASLAVACFGLLLWLVVPAPPVGFYWDDAWYLMMAEWLSGRSEHRDLAWAMLHVRQYPPGYPTVLAAVGAGLQRPDAGFVVNAVSGALAAFALMLWMRRRERFPMVPTVVAAALLVLNPVALTWLPTLFSEPLFVLLTVAALWLAACARTPQGWVLTGVVVGLAIITRSAGIALLIAVALSAALRQWRQLPWLVLGLGPALALGYWLTIDLPSVPRYRASLAELAGDLVHPAYLSAQLAGLARGWSEVWGSAAGGWIALAAVIPGFWVRIRRHCADAWLIPATLLMLIAWPFPGHMARFLWPLMPALLVCAAETARCIAATPLRRAASWTIPFIFALGLYGGAIRTISRVIESPGPPLQTLSRMHEWTRAENPELGTEALQFRHGLLLDMRQVEAETPANACVYSEYPALVAVQAKRASLASPWQRLSELTNHPLHCGFYYLVPLALPQTTAEDIERIGEQHDVLFGPPNPQAPSSEKPVGVLFRLNSNLGESAREQP